MFFLISLKITAQNSLIKGSVKNAKTAESVEFANIMIKGSTVGTQSDLEGNFELRVKEGTHIIVISSANFTPFEKSITIKDGETIMLNATLDEIVLKEVEVKVKAKQVSTNAGIAFMKKNDAVTQIVTAEAIRKSPDANAAAVMKRVTGASIQDGKYLVVRGLADRYNQTMVNRVIVGSTEPDRKVFSYDIFPAAVIENIVINKSYTSDLPGEWAGGLVQVNTKDIPSESFANVSVGTGINTQVLGKTYLSHESSVMQSLGLGNNYEVDAKFPSRKGFNNLSQNEMNNYGKSLSNEWNTVEKALPINMSLQANGGTSGKLFNKNVGGVFGIQYVNSNRLNYGNLRFYQFNDENNSLSLDYKDNKYVNDISVGALANVGMELSKNSSIRFRNLLSVISNKYVNDRTGTDYEFNSLGASVRAQELGYKQNIFYNTALSGEHTLEASKIKVDWVVSYTLLDQKIPDLRRLQYNQDDAQSPWVALIGSASTISQKSGFRFFSHLNDYIINSGVNVSKEIKIGKILNTIKVGYLFTYKDRYFNARPFGYTLEKNNYNLLSLPQNEIFNVQNIGYNGFSFKELSVKQNQYTANSFLHGAYLNINSQINDFIKVNYGVRLEYFDNLLNAYRINTPISVSNVKLSILPSINATYSMNEKNNLRAGYSKTVIRPEFRELAPFTYFDFDLNAGVLGNDNLKATDVHNFDLRYEMYPNRGELFTIGAFYKYFINPIEQYFNQSGVNTSTYNYQNPESAYTIGIETEFRKKLDFSSLLQNFTVFGNVAVIQNKVPQYNRSMQGQSPYIVNAGLQYDNSEKGISGIVVYNVAGRRLAFVGNADVPGIYENARPLLDIQLSKKLNKERMEIKFAVNDLLNRTAVYYHNVNRKEEIFKNTTDVNAIERRFGTNISVTFQYKIK